MSDWKPNTRHDYLHALMSPYLHVNQITLYLTAGLRLSTTPDEIREMIQRGAEAAQDDFNNVFLVTLVLLAKGGTDA